MTGEEAISYVLQWNDKADPEALRMAIKALEKEPCEDCIGREEAKQFLYERLDRLNDDELYDIFSKIIDDMYNELSPVTPQQKMGCEGCIYEKTGTNSTYPCSHCSRCYTDKYKAESEG